MNRIMSRTHFILLYILVLPPPKNPPNLQSGPIHVLTQSTSCHSTQKKYHQLMLPSTKQIFTLVWDPPVEHKLCSKCKEFFSLDHFYKQISSSLWRSSQCRSCQYKRKSPPPLYIDKITKEIYRICRCCWQILPISYFQLSKGKPHAICKYCCKYKRIYGMYPPSISSPTPWNSHSSLEHLNILLSMMEQLRTDTLMLTHDQSTHDTNTGVPS